MIDYLKTEQATYESMRVMLHEHHAGKFVVIKGDKLLGSYDTFDTAAREAIRAYGRGPYLIREVKEPTVMRMPSSVAFRSPHATY